jgi:aspartate carbamoyltransferase catalytic subunit
MGQRKHLLGLEGLSVDELTAILDRAATFKPTCTTSAKKHDTLAGKTVLMLFFEPSTRTSISFGLAARRLSADAVSFSKSSSSTTKGETLADTAKTIEAMGIDIVVVRHSSAGAPQLLTRAIDASIINAGDGAHEHPTQGLLDIFTIREKLGKLAGLKVAIVGDIAHSRVARSDIHGLVTLGAKVTVCGPATLVPEDISALGIEVSSDFDQLLEEADVINMLRIQRERLRGPVLPSDADYTERFGLTRERAARLKPDCLVMHPGPMNRGVEIDSAVADGPKSVILEQVTNGVAVRMAVLAMVAGP